VNNLVRRGVAGLAQESASAEPPQRTESAGRRRPKTAWTKEEVTALENGLTKYQCTRWADILKDYQNIFQSCRSQIDLKDKARNEIKRRQTNGESLDGFKYAKNR
jgi:hypothetical protein